VSVGLDDLHGSRIVGFGRCERLVDGLDLIRVAVTRDISQAVPISGSFVGAAGSYLGMTVDVTVVSEAARQPERRSA